MQIPQVIQQNKSKIVRWTIGLGVLIALLLWSAIKLQDATESKYRKDMDVWKAESARITQRNDSLTKVADGLMKTSDSVNKVADVQSREIARLRRIANRNNRPRPQTPPELPDTCKPALLAALEYGDSQKVRGDSLEQAVVAAEKRDTARVQANMMLLNSNRILRLEIDTLRRVIRTVPEYKPVKVLGFIPAPSRATTLGIGIVVGMIVKGAVDNQR